MTQRSALVTGATGFIGAHLVGALLAGGWQVRAVGRRPRPLSLPAEVDYRVADLTGEDDLAGIGRGITHVFHLAGASSSLSSEEEMYQANVVATQRLVRCLQGFDVERLVYLSSSSVYGEEEQLPLPVPEDAEPRPTRGYGKAKWQAERAVWSAGESGLPGVVLRPVTVYGPGNIKLLASTVLDAAIERFAGRRTLPVHAGVVEQRLVHVADVVRACVHLAEYGSATGRTFNIVLPCYPTNHQIIEMVSSVVGSVPELSDDPECGSSYEERVAQRSAMLAAGMRPDILLTKERFRF